MLAAHSPLLSITTSTPLPSITASTPLSSLLSSPPLPPWQFCHLYFAIHSNHSCSPNFRINTTQSAPLYNVSWRQKNPLVIRKTELLINTKQRELQIELLHPPRKSIFSYKWSVLTAKFTKNYTEVHQIHSQGKSFIKNIRGNPTENHYQVAIL